MTFEIKMTYIFGPLSITFNLRCLFSAKMTLIGVFGRIGYREPKQFQLKWPRWFFLVHWNTVLSQSQSKHFLSFLQVLMGVCGVFWQPVQGGSSEMISNFLSSVILYNHSSYLKSGEINSCRLSPLPITRKLIFFSLPKPNFTAKKCYTEGKLMKMWLVMVTIIKLTQ